MSRIRTRSIQSGVHHSNPYTTEDLVTNTSLILIYNPNPNPYPNPNLNPNPNLTNH